MRPVVSIRGRDVVYSLAVKASRIRRGIRPRSLAAKPCPRAHSRTAAVSSVPRSRRRVFAAVVLLAAFVAEPALPVRRRRRSRLPAPVSSPRWVWHRVEFVAGGAVVQSNRRHGLGAVTVKIAGQHDARCLGHVLKFCSATAPMSHSLASTGQQSIRMPSPRSDQRVAARAIGTRLSRRRVTQPGALQIRRSVARRPADHPPQIRCYALSDRAPDDVTERPSGREIAVCRHHRAIRGTDLPKGVCNSEVIVEDRQGDVGQRR